MPSALASTTTTAGRPSRATVLAAQVDIPNLPLCLGKPVSVCTVIHGHGPSVLLVGDSLARMWLPAFAVIADREHFTLSIAAFSACPWQPTLGGGLRISPGCTQHRADWYARVIPTLKPSIIVVAQRGLDKPGNQFFVPGPAGQVLVRSPQGEVIIEKATALGFKALQAAGRKVVVIDSTPLPADPNFDPTACLLTARAEVPNGCSFRVDTTPTALDLFYQKKGQTPGIVNLNLTRLVCPRLPVCDPVVRGLIVHRDHTHITRTYARSLALTVEHMLQSAGVLAR